MPYFTFPAALLSLFTLVNEPLPVRSNTLPVVVSKANSVNKTLMLQLVNEVRQKGYQCGDTYYYPVPAVSWNEKLEEAALTHSDDMNEREYFSHKSPEGLNGGFRIDQAGYTWRAFGENIAHGYSNEKAVLEGWLKSPGHCKNIMSRRYKEMGVARVGSYWTQEFASK